MRRTFGRNSEPPDSIQPLMRLRRSAPALAVALALTGAGVALAAHPLAGAHYSGTTSQHFKKKFRSHGEVSFDVSASGKRLVHPSFYLRTRCVGGGTSFATTSRHTTATASGQITHSHFALRFSEKARVAHHVEATANFTLEGRFASRKRAKGTLSVKVRYSSGAECDSGVVNFSVHS